MKAKILQIILLILLSLICFDKAEAFMFWNQACSFPGTSGSGIVVPNSSSLDITGSFSFEAWLRPVNSTNPTAQILLEKRAGTGSNGYTVYLNAGRVAIRTNTTTRLVGNTVLSNTSWTHISATYNTVTNLFCIYINGILDADTNLASADPITNTDLVRIGFGNVNSPYAGAMDEVRLWRRALSATEVAQYRRTSLGTSSGLYGSLVLSLTFQNRESSGALFSLLDWSGANNNASNNGANVIDLSDRPSNTITINESLDLDGSTAHVAGPDNADVSPTAAITLEAWIYPRNVTGIKTIMVKGSGGNYGIRLNGPVLQGIINGNASFSATGGVVVANIWNHVAFTYKGSNGSYAFYINGRKVGGGTIALGMIVNGTDSLYIGGNDAMGNLFNGYVDEARISNYVKPQTSINRFMYQSIDKGNEPDTSLINVVYNFDGLSIPNCDNGPRLYFTNNARYSHPGVISPQPVSPIDRVDDLFFSKSFALKTVNSRIPVTGIVGTVVDSFEMCLDTIISDINIFVALNHTAEEELELYIMAPNGETVPLYLNQALIPNASNVITIFDDQADSNIINNSRYTSFSPRVKPRGNLSMFNGDRSGGTWKLIVNDETGNNTGFLYAWGAQINGTDEVVASLCLKVFMEGFYRENDSCVQDVVDVYIMDDASPFGEVGVMGQTPDDNLVARYNFPEAVYGESYYLKLQHRNSLETWSAHPVNFDLLSGCLEYDFTVDPDSAYGSNEIQVDNIPLRFAMYGGDVDKNGSIDGTDLSTVDNDAANFVAGYVVTDLTGDDFVDATDYAIVDNNASNFISVIRP